MLQPLRLHRERARPHQADREHPGGLQPAGRGDERSLLERGRLPHSSERGNWKPEEPEPEGRKYTENLAPVQGSRSSRMAEWTSWTAAEVPIPL